MILGQKELDWQRKVTETALREGWTVFHQVTAQDRRYEPNVVLVHGRRVVLAYLRTAAPRNRPPADRFDAVLGVEAYVWCPRDWPAIRALLTTPRSRPRPGPEPAA